MENLRVELVEELKALNYESEEIERKRDVILKRIKEIKLHIFRIDNGYEVGKEIQVKGETVKISSIRWDWQPVMYYVNKKKDGTWGKQEHRFYNTFNL